MGASESTEIEKDHVRIPRHEYFEKVKHYGTLEQTIKDQKLNYALVKKALETTKVEAAKKEMSLKSQLQQYESVPILKDILNTLTKIKELDEEVNNHQRSDISDETMRIQNNIKQLKDSVDTLRRNTDKDVSSSVCSTQSDELVQLENNVKENTGIREEKFEKIHKNLDGAKKKVLDNIEKLLGKIHKDIEDNRILFDKVREENAHPDYHRIKSILMEQENILLKCQLSKPQTQPAGYNLIFSNVPDKSNYGKSDYLQVQEILTLIGISTVGNLTIQRFGKPLPNKPRLLKVIFPNTDLTEFILKQRYKLRNMNIEYSTVWISPDKYENRK